jgi:ABC-type bacteriocin/lantibiotic exporter with double-glycine peptidase domain
MPANELPDIPTLPVQHYSQQGLSDCLAACALMVLDYLGKPMPYGRLLRTLDIGPIGAPRRNILRLSEHGIGVVYREASLTIIADYLKRGLPVIAFVDTGELSYWTSTTNHAVVIIGFTAEVVILLDPACPAQQYEVTLGEFLLAWLNCDYSCAVLQ